MSTIGGCIEKKSNGIAANNVLIESLGENAVRFYAMGNELTMRYDAEAKIEKAGKLCLDGGKLAALAPVLPDGEVSFESQANFWANLYAGNSKPKIAGVDPKQYPEVPSGKSTPISIEGERFHSLIKQTVFVASEETSQYALAGMKFEIGDGFAKMVGAITLRLAYSIEPVSEGDSLDFILPKKTAIEALKIDADEIRIGDDQNHIFIEGNGLLLISRKLSGKFPPYQAFFPKDNKLTVSFDITELKEAVRRCGMFAALDTIRCDIETDLAVLSARSADAGEIEESVSVIYSGEPQTIGFNWPHLMDFLNLAGNGKIDISFNENPTIPALLTAENLPDYQYILVLVNIAAQQNIAQKQASKPIGKSKAKKK